MIPYRTDAQVLGDIEARVLCAPPEGCRRCTCGHDYDDHDIEGGRGKDDEILSPCAINDECDCYDFEVPDNTPPESYDD